MNNAEKLKFLEAKVARLESKFIQQGKGLTGFVEFIEEIKKDMVDDEYLVASRISGYYTNLDKRVDKALLKSQAAVHQSLGELEKQIALYDRAILNFSKYVGQENLTDTVYSSPLREADVVLRSSVQKQIQVSHSIKVRLESVLHDLKEMRKGQTNYSKSDAEIEQMIRDLPPKRKVKRSF
mgnify:CR=1 FL=1